MWMWSSTLPCERRPPGQRRGLCCILAALCLSLGGWQAQAADLADDHADNATDNATGNATQGGIVELNATAWQLPPVDLELPLRARNPFTPPRVHAQAAAAQQDASLVSMRFDGSTPATSFQGDPRLIPRIKVVGVLDNGHTISVLAEVENRGRMVLREQEQIYLKDGKSNKDEALWFTVQRISHKGMTLMLKNGMVVEGHFF